MKTILIAVMCAMSACAAAPTETSTSQNSAAADNYAWMVGHWTCGTVFNGYSTVPPQYKLHHVTADYRFTLLEDEPDHLLVHEEYREQTVEPGFPAFDYDSDITIDLVDPPGSQGHTSRIVVKYANGDAVDAVGALNGRTSVFRGSYSYHGEIMTAVDGATRTWSRSAFDSDPNPARRPFGDFGDNFRIQIRLGTEQLYLGTDCLQDFGHE